MAGMDYGYVIRKNNKPYYGKIKVGKYLVDIYKTGLFIQDKNKNDVKSVLYDEIVKNKGSFQLTLKNKASFYFKAMGNSGCQVYCEISIGKTKYAMVYGYGVGNCTNRYKLWERYLNNKNELQLIDKEMLKNG